MLTFDGKSYSGREPEGKAHVTTRDRRHALRLWGREAVRYAETDLEAHENAIISRGRYL